MASRGTRRRCIRLDAESLNWLYRRHAEPLLLYFARRLFDAEAAGDLVAETFATAFQSRGKFRGTTEDEAIGFL
jgi:DNA-directed RNA polymerase specialized sigma24 family protein